MGNTIRREPVSFDLPKTPDYRHLNITNFRGLDVSSNPFELDSNTASDCLNVYVDESNTLTTRPRLQKKYLNLLDVLGKNWEPIGYYQLHNGYLLHGKQGYKAVMKLFIETEKDEYVDSDKELLDVNPVSPLQIPTNKCKVFEQGDTIYLLTGTDYLRITNDHKLASVEGYIPTTATVDIDGNRHEVESLNLLSDKYKESYYWDGLRKPKIDLGASNISVGYEKIDFKAFFGENKHVRIHKVFPKEHKILVGVSDPNAIEGLAFTNEKPYLLSYKNAILTNLYEFDVDTTHAHDYYYVGCGETTDYIYFATTTKLNCFHLNSVIGTYNKSTVDVNLSEGWHIEYLKCDPSGYYCYINIYNFNTQQMAIQRTILCYTGPYYNFDGVGYNGKLEFGTDLYSFYEINNLLYVLRGSDLFLIETNRLIIKGSIPKDEYGQTQSISTSVASDIVWVWTGKEYDLYSITDLTNKLETYSAEIVDARLFSNAAYVILRYNDSARIKIIPDITNYSDNYISPIYIQDDTFVDIAYYPNNYYSYYKTKQEAVFYVCINDYIDVTTSTTNKNWSDKRDALLKSYINTRFDNNYWFASGNRYYRSRNNDPTYFPITEYNDLGDSNLPITGFNLANDTTLIAYKDDRLYLVQPFETSSGAREYSITESKNTVGNTAIDAPIVTTLTEIPLQINYDGVYGLSQLSNVSATERIADLMSRPINQRWLDIPDTLIKNAKTLNRLYWTYIIIPDNDYTQIYLLDNRTNSWYYWELPIVVADSFVVDNRTEFADKNGEIYYLTTTDIDVPNDGNVLITEYYDDGEKLIDWYWQSQIMHLGTINYTKRLVNTTFILTDDDTTDGYGLKYGFKVFRKLASSVPDHTISNDINLVRSTTQKTNISKFGFLQMKISNITAKDSGTEQRKEFRNNKLRLVGLGLKYVLLEGMIK